MAAPHVAGLAALMKSKSPALTPAQVESTLRQGTRAMPGGCTKGCGAGLSDATATMGLLGGTTPPPPSGNLLLNPGFESGPASWTSDHADTFETGTERPDRQRFRRPERLGPGDVVQARPDHLHPVLRDRLQPVLLPEDADRRDHHRDRLRHPEGPGHQRGVTTTLATYSNLNKSTGYVLKTLDLTSFKGKTVTLRFLGVEDSSLKTYFFVDDTSVTTS